MRPTVAGVRGIIGEDKVVLSVAWAPPFEVSSRSVRQESRREDAAMGW
jgi:hypothetical protein